MTRSHVILSQQEHLFHIDKIVNLQLVEVKSAGKLVFIEMNEVFARTLKRVHKRFNMLPCCVVNIDVDESRFRQGIENGRFSIERIRIVLVHFKACGIVHLVGKAGMPC